MLFKNRKHEFKHMYQNAPKNNNKIILKNQTEPYRIKYDIQYLSTSNLHFINNTQLNVMKQIEYINYKDQIKENKKKKKRERWVREKSLTGLVGLAIGPLGSREMNLLPCERFTLVWLL